MVKLFCDRCGGEIKDKYFTIGYSEESLEPVFCGCAASMASQSFAMSSLQELNAKRIYCEECKIDIFSYASRKVKREVP